MTVQYYIKELRMLFLLHQKIRMAYSRLESLHLRDVGVIMYSSICLQQFRLSQTTDKTFKAKIKLIYGLKSSDVAVSLGAGGPLRPLIHVLLPSFERRSNEAAKCCCRLLHEPMLLAAVTVKAE